MFRRVLGLRPDPSATSASRPRLARTSALKVSKMSMQRIFPLPGTPVKWFAPASGYRLSDGMGNIPNMGDDLRTVLGRNLAALQKWAKESGSPKLEPLQTAVGIQDRTEALGQRVSDSAIGRYLACADPETDEKDRVAAPITALEAIALAFGVQPWHLLYPTFDPANPPEVLTPERVQELEEILMGAAKILGKQLHHESARPDGDDGEDHGRTTDRKVPGKSAQKKQPYRRP